MLHSPQLDLQSLAIHTIGELIGSRLFVSGRLTIGLASSYRMNLPLTYLTERITLEEVLAEYDFQTCHPEFKADWERLLSKRTASDELWRIAPPPRSIQVTGIALVRNGEVISTLVESVS